MVTRKSRIMSRRQREWEMLFLLLAAVSLANAGCGLFRVGGKEFGDLAEFGCSPESSSGEWWSPAACHSKYYFLAPTPFEHEKKEQNSQNANMQGNCEDNVDICDASVLAYAGLMKSILRERMNNARITRSIGGATQVLTAATAALLAGVGGGGAISAIAALSGASSVIPPISEVFGTRERAGHFAEGTKQIEDHIAAYLKKTSDNFKPNGQPPTDKLTKEGAELYESVVATIHVVEDQLVGILPDPRRLQQATAEEFPKSEP